MWKLSCIILFLLSGFPDGPMAGPDPPGQAVTGRITNSETGEPLENVNVYLSYTTTGTSTDSSGYYALTTSQLGVFDLIMSRVGFARHSQRITLQPGDFLLIDVSLAPAVLESEPVVITSTPDLEWSKNLQLFTRAFIGHSAFSEQCRIVNPGVLEFELNNDTLLARSDSVIRVENRALGYMVNIIIAEFVWNTAKDYGHFLIYPYFTRLRPGDPDESALWTANREIAFKGSIRHFLRSLIRQSASDELFSISSGPLLKIRKTEGHMVTDADFQIDPAEGFPLFMVSFPGYLRIEYGERDIDLSDPGGRYARRVAVSRLAPRPRQVSIIRLTGPSALVDSSGNLFDPLAIEVSGYWGDHRIENLLPNN